MAQQIDVTVTESTPAPITEARLWHDDGWLARVIKNEDDVGWAVAMTKDGEPKAGLVVPWTMGRDKENPTEKSEAVGCIGIPYFAERGARDSAAS